MAAAQNGPLEIAVRQLARQSATGPIRLLAEGPAPKVDFRRATGGHLHRADCIAAVLPKHLAADQAVFVAEIQQRHHGAKTAAVENGVRPVLVSHGFGKNRGIDRLAGGRHRAGGDQDAPSAGAEPRADEFPWCPAYLLHQDPLDVEAEDASGRELVFGDRQKPTGPLVIKAQGNGLGLQIQKGDTEEGTFGRKPNGGVTARFRKRIVTMHRDGEPALCRIQRTKGQHDAGRGAMLEQEATARQSRRDRNLAAGAGSQLELEAFMTTAGEAGFEQDVLIVGIDDVNLGRAAGEPGRIPEHGKLPRCAARR